MNLRDLEYIVSIAELGSMAKAAVHSHVSQSTLSIQLKKLEASLGVAIFERSNKKLIPTAAGKRILDVARGIVQESRRLRDIAKSHHDPFSLTLRLGVFPTLAPYFLPHVMPAIRKSFPNLVIQLVEEKSPILTEKLLAGEIDAALLSLPVEGLNLASTHLFDDPFLLACAKNHPLAKRASISMADLADETLLLLDDGHCLRNQALEFCYLARAHESGEFRATSLETLRHMVAAGTGMTLIPKIACLPTPNLAYIPFVKKVAPLRKIGLVWRASTPQKKLMDTLAALFKKTYLQ